MLYVKALHLIFIVTWFAGLFYMPRLFIYHIEAIVKKEPEKSVLVNQFKIMERRLWYGITWPSLVITFILGFWLAFIMNPWYQTWFWIKLSLVAGLFVYHMICHKIFVELKNDIIKYSSGAMRMWNEVATLFLFAIVFVVVLKNSFSLMYALGGFFVLILLLLTGIKIYQFLRKK